MLKKQWVFGPLKRQWHILERIERDGSAKSFVCRHFDGVEINLLKERSPQ